jgi:hypothetical protein
MNHAPQQNEFWPNEPTETEPKAKQMAPGHGDGRNPRTGRLAWRLRWS